MKIYTLKNGQQIMLDDEDFERLKHYRYYFMPNGYAYRPQKEGKKQAHVLIHHDVVGKHQGMVVDHINGNKLDNRRENLRVVTNAQNLHNVGKYKKGASSKYKGVSWNSRYKVWQAHITIDCVVKNLGWYTTQEAAAIAYNEAVKENRDSYAFVNDVPYDSEWKSKRIRKSLKRKEVEQTSFFIGKEGEMDVRLDQNRATEFAHE